MKRALMIGAGVFALTGATYALFRRATNGSDRAAKLQRANLWLRIERTRLGLRRKSALVSGFNMPYLDSEIGQETIVCIHGIAADKDHFARLSGRLKGSYRVISVDLPGFGESDRDPSADYGVDAQARRILAFTAALGLGAVHLVGNSMGGLIANRAAILGGESVKSLSMYAPALVPFAGDSEVTRLVRRTGKFPILISDARDFAAIKGLLFVRAPRVPASIDAWLAERAVEDAALHQRIFVDLVSGPKVEAVRVPTLCIWGDADRVLDASGADALLHLMPHAKVLRLPAVGHLPMLEKVADCARLQLEFLREVKEGAFG
jgi:abhydrolase domain-containing protein 6